MWQLIVDESAEHVSWKFAPQKSSSSCSERMLNSPNEQVHPSWHSEACAVGAFSTSPVSVGQLGAFQSLGRKSIDQEPGTSEQLLLSAAQALTVTTTATRMTDSVRSTIQACQVRDCSARKGSALVKSSSR